MKSLIFFLLMFLSLSTIAQSSEKDTPVYDPRDSSGFFAQNPWLLRDINQKMILDTPKIESAKHLLVTSLNLSSKNYWRGNVYGNNAPTLSGTLALHTKSHSELGITGTSPISGNRDGFGIWMELYASQTIGNFTFTIDDYYFFNVQDSLNDYFNWGSKKTQHLVEGRIKYDVGRFNITGSYVLYAATGAVNSLYLEGEYFLIPKLFSLSGGAVLGQSALNFYDKGGITHIGATGYRDLKISKDFTIPIKVAAMTSPNYKNASKYPGFTQNPINIIVTLSF